jgi:hypothetical protein
MKKIIYCTIVAVITIAAGWNINQNRNEVTLSDVALENIEALADEGGGTSVGTCYLLQHFSSDSSRKKFCDSNTNNSTIYPCPTSETYGGYIETAQDRCTK